MRKIVITGGAGFLGQRLARGLLRSNLNVKGDEFGERRIVLVDFWFASSVRSTKIARVLFKAMDMLLAASGFAAGSYGYYVAPSGGISTNSNLGRTRRQRLSNRQRPASCAQASACSNSLR